MIRFHNRVAAVMDGASFEHDDPVLVVARVADQRSSVRPARQVDGPRVVRVPVRWYIGMTALPHR